MNILSPLYNYHLHVEEAEAQLREEAKIIERMTRDNKSKQDQINAMENLLQREAEKHQEMRRLLEDEHATQKHQADHEIEVLRRQVCQLELHVEAYDVLEAANGKLRDRVEQLMLEMEQENKTHAEEIYKVRLDMFNHKMALEKTFRKALQELDADYLKKAFHAMSEESKNALVANAKLKDELQLQSIGVDNLMHRFTQQAKHFQRMKVENEILEQESHLRLQEVAAMKKIHLTASRTIDKLKEDVNKEEQEWKEHTNKVVEDLRHDNQHLHKLHELAQKRCNKWKSRCMELTEREAARRTDEQRAQTAPAAATALSSMIRVRSQPAFSPHVTPTMSFSARDKGPNINYDEMWSHAFALRTNQHNDLTIGFVEKFDKKTKKLAKVVLQQTESETIVPSGTDESIEQLHRIATSALDMVSARAATSQTSRKKTHRLGPTIVPRKGQSIDAFNFAS
ncbi:uncharacterized protein PITG_19117 [Phytophthora infestans T30-4]|uniref:Cilia- and flagella-associated protein 157 n=1 Tax=Phytophthora infestans (strain T30-4) TaxID=403677 RepID=D0NYV8_PHYIT|nr:uncharacterized protein PITG_19117 [Phytophthora infestans T30-4]EEY68741.1 conserved hypothetical protein [Phytophthora infestans T30-4]|eukprot:XP_002997433.1 conserved hypothetical protein [Phytophthora infestans T30-4]